MLNRSKAWLLEDVILIEPTIFALNKKHSGTGAPEVSRKVRQRKRSGDAFEFTKERRNVFDDQQLDLSQLRVGKKT